MLRTKQSSRSQAKASCTYPVTGACGGIGLLNWNLLGSKNV